MKYFIDHYTGPGAYYDIVFDLGDSLVTFRIAQFVMLYLQDGTEISAKMISDPRGEDVPLDKALPCDRGNYRHYDSGLCAIEQWSDAVMVINLLGPKFTGAMHILKTTDSYSMRFIRSRNVPARR
jgi:hypothetical protein